MVMYTVNIIPDSTYSPVSLGGSGYPAIAAPPRHRKRPRRRKPKPPMRKVYLNWPNLGMHERLHLSQYRTTAGLVVRERDGLVGVRFNGDPGPLAWLAPEAVSSYPIYDHGEEAEYDARHRVRVPQAVGSDAGAAAG